jgi:hypothetical protein
MLSARLAGSDARTHPELKVGAELAALTSPGRVPWRVWMAVWAVGAGAVKAPRLRSLVSSAPRLIALPVVIWTWQSQSWATAGVWRWTDEVVVQVLEYGLDRHAIDGREGQAGRSSC